MQNKMRVLAIGDIFGRPGRTALRTWLPDLIRSHSVDAVIANGENAAGGRGITPKVVDEILESRVMVITAGNHTLEYDVIVPYLSTRPMLRPFNIDQQRPGRGWICIDVPGKGPLVVISLQGRIFMDDKGVKARDPFRAMDELFPVVSKEARAIVVDFHAEATSEKRALAWYLDGRVSAVLGTHTHVQTADEEILPQGAAYISDLGMTGPHASVVGLDKDIAIQRFLTGERDKFKVAESGVRLEGVVLEVDGETGKALSIERIQVREGAARS